MYENDNHYFLIFSKSVDKTYEMHNIYIHVVRKVKRQWNLNKLAKCNKNCNILNLKILILIS